MHRFMACSLLWAVLIAYAPAVSGGPAPASNWLNAKEAFGLVGDGVADDTAGIQAMFRAHGPVFLPSGTYRITQTVSARPSWLNTKVRPEDWADAIPIQIHGSGGGWNPKGQSTILYDGPDGGIALRIVDCSFFSMRHVTVDGGGKAGVGVYWFYSTNETYLEDCSIIHTTRHALFVTKTWYAHFNRLCVRNNDGRGVTLDRGAEDTIEPDLAKGPVNFVTFFECKFSKSGQRTDYDGNTVVNTGYGFGMFGCNSVINIISCVFESNGGPGIYLGGHPVNVSVNGCYFENNSLAVRRLHTRYRKTYGKEWLTHKDRGPLGRRTHIIEDTGSPWSVVFDNCYCHGTAGIWLRGQGNNNPIEFRNLRQPTVIWSEHANWVVANAKAAPVAGRPGPIRRTKENSKRHFFDPIPGPSGHPGYVTWNGVCRVWPHSADGLSLFVDTDTGDDRNDGRSPATAWKSLAKATSLFSNTTLDTPVTITVAGTTATGLDLRNVLGSGTITIVCESDLTLGEAVAANVMCRLVLEGNRKLVIPKLRISRCLDVEITGVVFKAGDTEGALICEGNSGVVVERCEATWAGKDAVVIAALRNSVVSLIARRKPKWPVRAERGGQVR